MVSPNLTKTQPGNMDNLQLQNGKLKHLIAIEGLGRDILTNILDTAESFTSHAAQPDKKIPLLRNKTIANLFFENSTRTRISFEIAASRLSANILHVDAITSSHCKGESMLDTVRNLEAMFVDMFVVRHNLSGTARFIAEHAAPTTAIINAGDGSHAHPTQAILDLFTIRQHKPNFAGLKIGIIGDILHSRVARSQIEALRTMGVQEIRVIAPETLCPKRLELLGVTIFSDMAKGLADLDVVIMLRLQKERMADALLPSEHEYFDRYGLTTARLRLAKPDAIVMHPGPINRGVEISSDVADGNQSVILQQARNGVAVRMAIISLLLQNQS